MPDLRRQQVPAENRKAGSVPTGPEPMQVLAAPADPPCGCPCKEQPCPSNSVPRMSCTEVPQPFSAGATSTIIALGPTGRLSISVEGDLECLVCRESYNCARSPKLLSCQHTFCAVCLKLLLFVQEDTWSITCPLCRKVTAVPGGLICSLRDQEAMVGRLALPCPEVRLCPQMLVGSATSASQPANCPGEEEQDVVSVNRVAARRLAVHLLLLALLIVLILPFIYPGVIQWVLAFIIVLALLMSTLFCCHPQSQSSNWPCSRTLFCRKQKQTQITSIA